MDMLASQVAAITARIPGNEEGESNGVATD